MTTERDEQHYDGGRLEVFAASISPLPSIYCSLAKYVSMHWHGKGTSKSTGTCLNPDREVGTVQKNEPIPLFMAGPWSSPVPYQLSWLGPANIIADSTFVLSQVKQAPREATLPGPIHPSPPLHSFRASTAPRLQPSPGLPGHHGSDLSPMHHRSPPSLLPRRRSPRHPLCLHALP